MICFFRCDWLSEVLYFTSVKDTWNTLLLHIQVNAFSDEWKCRVVLGRRKTECFLQVIKVKNIRQPASKHNYRNFQPDQILWVLWLLYFTKFNGKACESQFYFVEIGGILLLFCRKKPVMETHILSSPSPIWLHLQLCLYTLPWWAGRPCTTSCLACCPQTPAKEKTEGKMV